MFVKQDSLDSTDTIQVNERFKIINLLYSGLQILSTSIAETSITIKDVVFVIDSGKVKEVI